MTQGFLRNEMLSSTNMINEEIAFSKHPILSFTLFLVILNGFSLFLNNCATPQF